MIGIILTNETDEFQNLFMIITNQIIEATRGWDYREAQGKGMSGWTQFGCC